MSKKIKILMVDDEEQFRATTRKVLNKRGFEIILAGSGEEAIKNLKENPDVVILDIKMPGMDGHQALKEIKKSNPVLPVIMLTGHGDLPSAKESLTEGAFDYLSKPCDIDILASRVTAAYNQTKIGAVEVYEEKVIKDVMISIEDYTTIDKTETVGNAIDKLRESFKINISTSRIMETGHRSLLVLDKQGNVTGTVTINDLLNAIMPAYLSAPKPSMADTIQYSPMFWTGMFSKEIKLLAKKNIADVMSPAPVSVDENSNLMEVAFKMLESGERRLVVLRKEKVVGIVREQDLFFEIEKILAI